MILPDRIELISASEYTNPQETSAKLPIVYGNITDGEAGVWELPCIDTVNFVYAYAGHETLSVANGNSITIYVDDIAASATFDHADSYEGVAVISTITFGSSQDNAAVTARGKGKRRVGEPATLIDNPIEAIEDILLNEGFEAFNYNKTALEASRRVADAQGYLTAGVINETIETWQFLQEFLSSFNPPQGLSYIDDTGKLTLIITDGSLELTSIPVIVPSADIEFMRGTQRLDDLINDVEGNYRFNFAQGRYYGVTNEIIDQISVNQYGILKPSQRYSYKWNRNKTAVEKILRILLDRFSQPTFTVQFLDITSKRIDFDVNTIFILSIPELYNSDGDQLINEVWRVLSLRQLDNGLEIYAIDERDYLRLSSKYDGTYLYDGEIKYGGTRDTKTYSF